MYKKEDQVFLVDSEEGLRAAQELFAAEVERCRGGVCALAQNTLNYF